MVPPRGGERILVWVVVVVVGGTVLLEGGEQSCIVLVRPAGAVQAA